MSRFAGMSGAGTSRRNPERGRRAAESKELFFVVITNPRQRWKGPVVVLTYNVWLPTSRCAIPPASGGVGLLVRPAMNATPDTIDVSVIIPARNEEANLQPCLQSLVSQTAPPFELIVVDDHSTDRTRSIAQSFPTVRVLEADPLPDGWSGKSNACWTGAKLAKGKWLLFTDADTRHVINSIEQGFREAASNHAALLSYSPKQEVHGFWEHALMP
ncbi:MAG TPA: glycosyltransferase family A protein, partial [Terriglobales bacterium]